MKVLRPRLVTALAVLMPITFTSAPSLAGISQYEGLSKPVRTNGSYQLAQAAEPEAVVAARADVAAAEEALRTTEAANGDVESARKAVKKARRVLAQALADAGLPLTGEKPVDAPTEQTAETPAEQPAAGEPAQSVAEQPEAPAAAPASEDAPKETAGQPAADDAAKAETGPVPADAEKPLTAKEQKKLLKQQKKAEKQQAKDQEKTAEADAKEAEELKAEITKAEPLPDAPTGIQGETADPKVEELRRKLAAEREKVRKLEARQDDAPAIRGADNRSIIQLNGQVIIRNDSETDRILRGAQDIEVLRLPRGRTQTVVTRPNGARIITIRDADGAIIYRLREQPNGRELVLIDNRDLYEEGRPRVAIDIQLPPIVFDIPQREYIVEMGDRVYEDDLRLALIAPPVEKVERAYSLEEVRYSERLREKLRRIDVSVTFDTGSAAISRDEVPALDRLAQAMETILESDPDTIFLVEGHTDAVGSQIANLALSDRRAESVAIALAEFFDIPPENLVTQGYGEDYLKVPTPDAERRNRRVAVRNITDLLRISSR